MESNVSKSILGGIVGTIIMTIVTMVAPLMGIPKMSPPHMLAGKLNVPIFVGWIMHFMIGIIFALAYTYLFAPKVNINNLAVKGAVFGFAVFIFAQIIMAIMGAIFPMPAMEGSMILTMIGSIVGHVVFGIGVSETINFRNK